MVKLQPLNPHDPLPLHAQLERAIKLAIVGGQLTVGQQLPTVRQLAVELRVNANTVARVYAELERQGVLATRRGVGTFVEPPQAPGPKGSRSKRAGQLRQLAQRFLAEAAADGFTPAELLEQIHRLSSNPKEKTDGQD